MRHVIKAALAAVVLGGCMGDETLTGYGAAGKLWRLQSIDGAPFSARATLEFPEQGQMTGQSALQQFHRHARGPLSVVQGRTHRRHAHGLPRIGRRGAVFHGT